MDSEKRNSASEKENQIVTPKGLEAPAAIADSCFLEGKILYISKTIENDPKLLNYQDFLFASHNLDDSIYLAPDEFEKKKQNANPTEIKLSSEGVVSWTDQQAQGFFKDASIKKASDIHILLFKDRFAKVLFRIHGALTHDDDLDPEAALQLMRFIYENMCDSEQKDTSFEQTKRQDGNITAKKKLPKGVHGIRVHTGPTVQGHKMVLRLLYDQTGDIEGNLDQRLFSLGYSKAQRAMFRYMVDKYSGLIVVAGPTGSGKSTTLKHLLETKAEDCPDLNILTYEDPAEYPMKGVTQESVKEGFAKALIGAMRGDPDIMMVGEIRDSECAAAALYGAQTGHPLYTTIHANSAWSVFTRLISLVPKDKYPNPLEILTDRTVFTGAIYQQLVLKVCPDCSVPLKDNEDRITKAGLRARINRVIEALPEEEKEEKYNSIRLAVTGKHDCTTCNGKGVIGRTVVAEVLVLDQKMINLIREDGVEAARTFWRERHKDQTRMQHALSKMFNGELDPHHIEARLGYIDDDVILEDHIIDAEELIYDMKMDYPPLAS